MAADRIRDSRKLVRIVTPKSYELAEVLNLVRQFGTPSRDRFVEGLWKYMLSTEAVNAIWDDLRDKPVDASWSAAETRIRDAVGEDPNIIDLSFASRVIKVVRTQQGSLSGSDSIPESVILGRLQSTEIQKLRGLICDYLVSEDKGLTLILDDIVPSWKTADERNEFAEILLHLVTASRELWRGVGLYNGASRAPGTLVAPLLPV